MEAAKWARLIEVEKTSYFAQGCRYLYSISLDFISSSRSFFKYGLITITYTHFSSRGARQLTGDEQKNKQSSYGPKKSKQSKTFYLKNELKVLWNKLKKLEKWVKSALKPLQFIFFICCELIWMIKQNFQRTVLCNGKTNIC